MRGSSTESAVMEEDSVLRDRRDERYPRQNDLSISRSSSSISSSSSSSFKLSYSVNSQSEYSFTQKSIEKSGKSLTYVKQLTMKFEKLSGDEKLKNSPKFSVGIFPWTSIELSQRQHNRIHEVPSEEEVEDISECEEAFVECDEMQQKEQQNFKVSVPDIFVDEFRDDSTDSNDSSSYQRNVESSLVGVRKGQNKRYTKERLIHFHRRFINQANNTKSSLQPTEQFVLSSIWEF